MSNATFPALLGLAWSFTRAGIWQTNVQQAGSGKELRATNWSYPIWEWTLSYEFLRAGGTLLEYETLVGFFNARRGQYDTFLFTDPDDNSATNQTFGTGDGTTTSFQLLRALGGFVEPVRDLRSVPVIMVSGAVQSSGYTVSSTGIVTFTTPPAGGAPLTWSGGYYFRCRFGDDNATLEQFQRAYWTLKQIRIRSVK